MKDLVAGESGFNYAVVGRHNAKDVRYCVKAAAEELEVRITSKGYGIAEKGNESSGVYERCQAKPIAVNPISGNRSIRLIAMSLTCMNSIV